MSTRDQSKCLSLKSVKFRLIVEGVIVVKVSHLQKKNLVIHLAEFNVSRVISLMAFQYKKSDRC